MRVTVEIRKSDLAALNLQLMFRHRTNLRAMAVVAALVFVYLAISRSPESLYSWGVAVISSILAGIVAIVVGTFVSLFFIMLSSNEKNGVTGKHTYELRDDGLFESTKVNEGLSRWAGIELVDKSASYIYIQISSYLFHIIPRRAFEDDDEFGRFYSEAVRQWKSAA